MISRFASFVRHLLARPSALPDSQHIRRDLGLTDWPVSIGPYRHDVRGLQPHAF